MCSGWVRVRQRSGISITPHSNPYTVDLWRSNCSITLCPIKPCSVTFFLLLILLFLLLSFLRGVTGHLSNSWVRQRSVLTAPLLLSEESRAEDDPFGQLSVSHEVFIIWLMYNSAVTAERTLSSQDTPLFGGVCCSYTAEVSYHIIIIKRSNNGLIDQSTTITWSTAFFFWMTVNWGILSYCRCYNIRITVGYMWLKLSLYVCPSDRLHTYSLCDCTSLLGDVSKLHGHGHDQSKLYGPHMVSQTRALHVKPMWLNRPHLRSILIHLDTIWTNIWDLHAVV